MGPKPNAKEAFLIIMDAIKLGVEHPAFSTVIFAGTTLHMAIQSSRSLDQDPSSFTAWIQEFFNYFMIWVYTGVMCLRIMSFGLFWHPDSFLRQPWCWLDILIVSSAWLDTNYKFGNFMFFMVLRGLKILVDTKIPFLSSMRGVTRALLNASGHVSINFYFLLFMMFFFGTLAVELLGMSGAERNRCSVQVPIQTPDGPITYWQAVMPIRTCRSPGTDSAGTCPGTLVDNATRSRLSCLGPDVQELDLLPFAQFKSLPLFNEYIPTNYTLWEKPSQFTWENLGEASLLMFAIFYKTGWVQSSEQTADQASSILEVAWVFLILFVNYYLLNLTVAALCLAFSESMKVEERLCLATAKPDADADDDDDNQGDDDGDDDEEQDLGGFQEEGLRDRILKEVANIREPEAAKAGEPCCGVQWGPLSYGVLGATMALEFVAGLVASRVPCLRPPFIKNKIAGAYMAAGHALRRAYANFITAVVWLVIPKEEGMYTYFDRFMFVIMGAFVLALAAQYDQFNLYKCGCAALDDVGAAPTCAFNATTGAQCPAGKQCFGNLCFTAWAKTACINPHASPTLTAQAARLQTPALLATVKDWDKSRAYWCAFSQYLHFVLLGCAALFAIELAFKFIGHQGLSRFLLLQSAAEGGGGGGGAAKPAAAPAAAKPGDAPNVVSRMTSIVMAPAARVANRLHMRNVMDSSCILLTVIGVVFTELSFGVQLFNANVSLFYLEGDPDGVTLFTPTIWRSFKFARLATFLRILYHFIPVARTVPAFEIVVRGCRSYKFIAFSCALLFIATWFFMLLGKEIFLFYGPNEGCNECLSCEFQGSTVSIQCVDLCQGGKPFAGCPGRADTQDQCNPNMCAWTPPGAGGKGKGGKCVWDPSRGGTCTANRATSHYVSNSADFDSNAGGLVTLGEILIGGSWFTDTAYATDVLGYGGLIFFIIFLYVTSYQFFRLFVAIIAQSFELTEAEKLQAQELLLDMTLEKEQMLVSKNQKTKVWDAEEKYDNFSFNTHFIDLLRGAQITLQQLAAVQSGSAMVKLEMGKNSELKVVPYKDDDSDEEEGPAPPMEEAEIQQKLTINKYLIGENANRSDADGSMQGLQWVRNMLKIAVEHWAFNAFILIVVIASIGATLIDSISESLQYTLSLFFLSVFVFEMVIKMIAFGPTFRKFPPGYFRNGWNQLDFILVLLQIFDVMENSTNLVFQKGDPNANIVKGFRCLRVLRLLSKLSSFGNINPLRDSLQALAASIPSILCLVLGLVVYMLLFAIIGMDQFQGAFEGCDEDGTGPTFGVFSPDKVDCVGNDMRPPSEYSRPTTWQRGVTPDEFAFAAPRTWGIPSTSLNFNSIGDSLYALFSVLQRSTMESLILNLVSMTERDKAPVKGVSILSALYIITFQILGGVFVSQVVIGIILSNLKIKSGLAFHTEDQLSWPATKKALENMPPLRSSSEGNEGEGAANNGNQLKILIGIIRDFVKSVRDNWKYDRFIALCVWINCATVATTHFGASKEYVVATFYITLVTLLAFVIDIFVQFIADPRGWLYSPKLIFDFIITLIGILEFFVLPRYGMNLGLASLRMFRLFILIANTVPLVSSMLLVVKMSIVPACAISILLGILLFIFGVIGTTFFPTVRFGDAIRLSSNFQDLGSSMWLMFQASSGQGGPNPTSGWADYVVEASVMAPYCTPINWLPGRPNAQGLITSPMGLWSRSGDKPLPDCGNVNLAIPYFFLFIFMCNYIILPTFAASVIVSYFEANLSKFALVQPEDLILFNKVFSQVMSKTNEIKISDPKQDKFDQLLMGLESAGCKLGFPTFGERYDMAKRMIKDKKSLKYDYTAALLIAVSEKCRAVTIVDIMRRRKAVELLQIQGAKPLPKRKPAKAGKLHAQLGLPSEYTADGAEKKDKDVLIDKETVKFSYNIHVMLDQLKNNSEQETKITEPEFESLKALIENDDEDLFVYFEEYVERAGDDYDKSKRWKALNLFARRAKDIAARCEFNPVEDKGRKALEKFNASRGKSKSKAEDNEEEEEEEEGKEGEEEHEVGIEGAAPGDGGGDGGDGGGGEEAAVGEAALDAAGGVLGAEEENNVNGLYGKQHAVQDAYGGLDLRDWSACEQCNEPVNNFWGSCPNCGAKISKFPTLPKNS